MLAPETPAVKASATPQPVLQSIGARLVRTTCAPSMSFLFLLYVPLPASQPRFSAALSRFRSSSCTFSVICADDNGSCLLRKGMWKGKAHTCVACGVICTQDVSDLETLGVDERSNCSTCSFSLSSLRPDCSNKQQWLRSTTGTPNNKFYSSAPA